MRSLATVSLVVLMTAALSPALASEAETIKAINASSNELDKAFEQNDKAAIKALMTPDHISVTPYYDTADLHRRPQRQLQRQVFAGEGIRDRNSGET